MRILLALALLAAACGSKKAVKSPANTATETAPEKEETGATDENKPDDVDAPTGGTAADPCDGGE